MADINEEKVKIIIEKIRKLFALSGSPNENEATSALAKAHELLKEYNLSLDSLEVEQEKENIVEEIIETGNRSKDWRTILMFQIAKTNYCTIYTNTIHNAMNGKNYGRRESLYKIMLVGKLHNVTVTKGMTDYLLKSVDHLSNKVDHKNKQSYKIGVSETLCQRLREMTKKDIVESNCRDLVVREDAAVKDYMDQKNLTKKNINIKASSYQAMMAGRQDGFGISLNPQIGQASKNPKIALPA